MRNRLFKLKTCILSLLVISSAVSAEQECCYEYDPCCSFQSLVEVKAGYFFFTNSKLRKIYDQGGLDLQLCASYPLLNLSDCWSLQAYGAVEYFRRSGRSLGGNQKTSVWSVPVNVGLKPVYAINPDLDYYFAIGPRYFYIQQHNNSSNIYRNKSKNVFGFFVNTGVNYSLCDCLVLDIFGEYSYGKVHFGGSSCVYTRDIQVGGLTFGGGLGYSF